MGQWDLGGGGQRDALTRLLRAAASLVWGQTPRRERGRARVPAGCCRRPFSPNRDGPGASLPNSLQNLTVDHMPVKRTDRGISVFLYKMLMVTNRGPNKALRDVYRTGLGRHLAPEVPRETSGVSV